MSLWRAGDGGGHTGQPRLQWRGGGPGSQPGTGLDIPYTGSGVNGTVAVCVKWDSSGLTWEGLQVLQDGGHGHLLLQGTVTEVLMVQEAEESSELWDELLQHWGGTVKP